MSVSNGFLGGSICSGYKFVISVEIVIVAQVLYAAIVLLLVFK